MDAPDQPKALPNWKDHPVIIAAVSAAGGIVFATQILFPVQYASMQDETKSLRTQVEPLKSKLSKLEIELKSSKEKLAESQMSNLFTKGSPYPIGLDRIKIGDPGDEVEKVFSDKITERTRGFLQVRTGDAGFDAVVYIFNLVGKEKRVNGALFFLNTQLPETFLQTKLVEALGSPSSPGPKKDCFVWAISEHLFVSKDKPYTFALNTYSPKCENDQ